MSFAGDGGIVEGFSGAVAFGSFEIKAALEAVGESGEARFTVGVGADLEVELAGVHESIGDVDFDLGGVDGGAGGISDGEFGGAGAECAVDDGDVFRVGLSGSGLRAGRD